MRNRRAQRFKLVVEPTQGEHPRRWTDVSDDPNDEVAVAWRAATLRSAWRPAVGDRVEFLRDRCRGKRVLDVGCVAHDVARMQSETWLHRQLADAASECIGVDVLEEGVQAMQEAGYRAVVTDLRAGLGSLDTEAPFEVIVAGELIEHVEAVDMLFRTASAGLADDGELIISTPNPYEPGRVRAGQRGLVFENVDHIFYAMPSGIAELAERHGLRLVEAMVTEPPPALRVGIVRALKQWIKGSGWLKLGVDTMGPRRVRAVDRPLLLRVLESWLRRSARFDGETFIYVIRR